MPNRNIVVIGGSAGALTTLTGLLEQLSDSLPATIFVVLHRHPTSGNWLGELLTRHTSWPVKSPSCEPLQPQHIYVAQPDLHLMLKDGMVLSTNGPRENQWRPAIDVLFRSAAVAATSRVIGVLLSGELDDGTAGLAAIKRCGGVAIAQEPASTPYPMMPEVAIANVPVDHLAAPDELPALIAKFVAMEAAEVPNPPEYMKVEVGLAEGANGLTTESLTNDPPASLSCPECGGPLWQRDQDGTQFRCLVGHAFGIDSLADGYDSALDRTLWAAIRQFEQRAHLARTMAQQSRDRRQTLRAKLHESRARESEDHAQRLRQLHTRYRTIVADDANS